MRALIAVVAFAWVACPVSSNAQNRQAAAQSGRPSNPVQDSAIPQLRRQGTATQLVVDGAPFLILGGELGNSTASSVAGMSSAWPKLRAMHLNTVLAPVYWEMIEPEERRFEFASVDSLIAAARLHGLRLVLLWFGSWKNSMSSYAPAYVKTNQARFPRTESTQGIGQEILSPFAASNGEVDARAFGALMRHLRTIDGTQHTVLMVQVENEIGMIPTARDHSAVADSLYAQPVPRGLMDYVTRQKELAPELRALWSAHGSRTSGSWQEVFGSGPQGEELFMAWYFARYTQRVIAAGKAEYPLPMFANAALIRPGYEPGRYVSAGPLPHLIDVWRAAAPALDFLAPDIYFPNFTEWAARYVRSGNPLFIPEATLGAGSAGAQAAVNAIFAFAAHDAIGFSPFAIETADVSSPLGRGYAVLEQLAPLILSNQGRGTMAGVMPPVAFDGSVSDTTQRLSLGEYTLTVTFQAFTGPPARTGGGLVIALAPDEFLIAGSGLTVTFAPRGPGAPVAGILRAREGRFEAGRWLDGRWLNGDQTHQGRHIRLEPQEFSIQRVKLYRYR
jgi:beta-galactosidase GanA